MPAEIRISDADIEYAERILIPGKSFDFERRSFIRNLDTIDLQAVPGSGKTTALLAKLLILEKYMPLAEGSGVLVISHTNSAIQEVEKKIRKYCPRLFSFPNFVGTIQSFVDQYLAVPFYLQMYAKRPIRIDNEIYEERASKFLSMSFDGFSTEAQKQAKYYIAANDLCKTIRYSHISDQVVLTNGYNGRQLEYAKPRRSRSKNYSDWTNDEKKLVRRWMFRFKKKLLQDGFLCFDDAYFLGFEYLRSIPKVKDLLQRRFQSVFVDEMQDMAPHQRDILDYLFFDNGNSVSKLQRIGDKNQAIYHEGVEYSGVWEDRDVVLELNGSHRLHPGISSVVEPFAMTATQIDGLGTNPDGSNIDIRPRIIVFDDASRQEVIPKFASTIVELQSRGVIPRGEDQKFVAVAWSTKPAANGQLRIGDYFPGFSREQHRPRVDHPNLRSYLLTLNQSEKQSLKHIHDNILNSFLRILRLEEIQDETGRAFTKQRLLGFIKDKDEDKYGIFQLKLYQWSLGVVRGQSVEVLGSIQEYLVDFLDLFGKTINRSSLFLQGDGDTNQLAEASQIDRRNVFQIDGSEGVEILISTVHASKGQTHTATLYMETYYKQGYESNRLVNQFKGEPYDISLRPVAQQSARMVYVGFSRPTHLLCVAIHKDRFDAMLNDIDRNVWEVVEIAGTPE